MSRSDLLSARALLDGYVDQDHRGGRRSKYYKKGSREELDARRAMARLLRSKNPLDRQLRDSLAGLFDPDPSESEQRKIEIVFQGRGKRRDHVRNTQIVDHVWNQLNAGGKLAAAITSAVEEFEVSEEFVKQIWGRYRRVYGRRAPY
jgi:hypothetical protein